MYSSPVFTPRSAKALSDIDNATPGSILSLKKGFLEGSQA